MMNDAPSEDACRKQPVAPNVEEETNKNEASIATDDTMVKREKSSQGQKEETATDVSAETGAKVSTKEIKKRVRRVGKTPTRKIAKLNEGTTSTTADAHVAVNGVTGGNDVVAEGIQRPEAVENTSIAATSVISKHDEKWSSMFGKLLEYKEKNKNTLVPQAYKEEPRLGRWVHYQRVEYWIFQQTGSGKITEDRIRRLDAIGFEWDPQKAQWDKMFERLVLYKKEHNNCKVPKSYNKDLELANWVRNQRLEQANLTKEGKKSRMTPERYRLLSDLGFTWSTATPSRARKNKEMTKKENVNEEKIETTTAVHVESPVVAASNTSAAFGELGEQAVSVKPGPDEKICNIPSDVKQEQTYV